MTPHPDCGAVAGDGPVRIHHVGVTVAQLERSLAFYRDLLGFRVIGVSDGEDVGSIIGVRGARARMADLEAGNGQVLEVTEYEPPSRGKPGTGPNAAGSCHLSFQVADLRSALARLARAGVVPIGETTLLEGDEIWQGCSLGDPVGAPSSRRDALALNTNAFTSGR